MARMIVKVQLILKINKLFLISQHVFIYTYLQHLEPSTQSKLFNRYFVNMFDKKENFVNNIFTVYIQYNFYNYVNLNLIKLDKLLKCL